MSDTRVGGNSGFVGVRCLAALLGVLLVAPGTIAAQEGPVLPGDVVRLTSADTRFGVKTGTIQSLNQDTLWLREERSETVVAISNESLRALWVADGWRHQTGKGALWGLLAGAAIGGAIGSTADFCFWNDCGPATGVGVLIGAPVGLLAGTFVGSAIRSRRWRSVAVPLAPSGLHVELQVVVPGPAFSFTP